MLRLDPCRAKSGGSLTLTAPSRAIKLQKSQPVLRKFAVGGIVPRKREGEVVIHGGELVLAGEPEEPHLVRRG